MTAIIRGLVVMSIAFGAVYRVFDSLSIAPTCIVMTPMPAIGNWDALHALIARRYGPNGPYYGFQSPEIG